MVKTPPANAEDIKDGIPSLDWEDSLEKATTTHSSILAWENPWTEEPGRLGYSSKGDKESDTTE